MYGQAAKITEKEQKLSGINGKNYFTPLENAENCQFTAIELVKGDNWEAIDFVVENETHALSQRFFDFKFNSQYSDKNKVPISKEDQLNDYFQKLKALFGNATTDERWEKGFTVRNPQSFSALTALLKELCVNQDKFRSKITLKVTNGTGYSVIPNYSGGVTERMSIPLAESKLNYSPSEKAKLNEVSSQKTPKGTEAPVANAPIGGVDNLPF